eukprot:Nk52_evm6s295 gene=Nk52_evmTU6s295
MITTSGLQRGIRNAAMKQCRGLGIVFHRHFSGCVSVHRSGLWGEVGEGNGRESRTGYNLNASGSRRVEDIQRILFVCPVWPEEGSTASAFRTLSLVEAARRHRNWKVSVASPAKAGIPCSVLKEQGVDVFQCLPNVSEESPNCLSNHLSSFKPSMVVFDRFYMEEMFGWLVREKAPNASRIVDTQDIHFLRSAREKMALESLDLAEKNYADKDNGGGFSQYLSSAASPTGSSSSAVLLVRNDRNIFDVPINVGDDMANRELASILRSDLSFVVSAGEMRVLLDKFDVPESKLALCSFLYGLEKDEEGNFRPDVKPFEEREGFATIGNFRHKPNMDSVEVLINSVWPEIKRREKLQKNGKPEHSATLHIYGAYSDHLSGRFHRPEEGIFFHGYVKDHLKALERHRIMLCPLRFGAGIKGKISDGWLVGTPSVSTSIGLEGMTDDFGRMHWGGLVSNDISKFASDSLVLYGQKGEWEKKQKNGFRLMQNLFDSERNGIRFVKALKDLNGSLEDKRSKDWLGNILWSSSNRCTEMFSKYIHAVGIQRDLEKELHAVKLAATMSSKSSSVHKVKVQSGF